MASAGSGRKLNVLWLIAPSIVPTALSLLAYGGWRTDWPALLQSFLQGPNRNWRLLALVIALGNLKNLPLVWTVRVFGAIFYHSKLRPSRALGPRALFVPIVTKSRATVLETDYNFHKSNSTYFSDCDVSRSHLVCYLLRLGMEKLADNGRTKLVTDPASPGTAATGTFQIMLGAVHCSFRREIAPYAGYEIWSSVLSWDRKWLFIVSYFVPAGLVRPTEWLDWRHKHRKTRPVNSNPAKAWAASIHACAVSKYVFKLGRLTIHPAVILQASGLLPDRPGGWQGGDAGVRAELSDNELLNSEPLDWKEIESKRRRGMQMARHFLTLDGLEELFDGGSEGALGVFGPG